VSTPSDDFLPPQLELGADDVVEAVEVVAEPEPGSADDPAASAAAEPRRSGQDGIGTRREGRERALSLLFEADQRGVEPLAAILDQIPVPPEPFVRGLVQGVSDHQAEIDDELRRRSVSWSLERMPAIDRALLRLGVYELRSTDVPVGACLSEAVELAKRYSTEDSHRFVNGVLSAVARDARPEG
jgi:N utilization substance protein B